MKSTVDWICSSTTFRAGETCQLFKRTSVASGTFAQSHLDALSDRGQKFTQHLRPLCHDFIAGHDRHSGNYHAVLGKVDVGQFCRCRCLQQRPVDIEIASERIDLAAHEHWLLQASVHTDFGNLIAIDAVLVAKDVDVVCESIETCRNALTFEVSWHLNRHIRVTKQRQGCSRMQNRNQPDGHALGYCRERVHARRDDHVLLSLHECGHRGLSASSFRHRYVQARLVKKTFGLCHIEWSIFPFDLPGEADFECFVRGGWLRVCKQHRQENRYENFATIQHGNSQMR